MNAVEDYFQNVPLERQQALREIWHLLETHLPEGFEPTIQYNMPSFVVPHQIYPAGYHCNPKDALPFISVASQKNFISLYHMGLYAEPALYDWFIQEYPKYSKYKLDMGKSCIRFKRMDDIPFELLASLFTKMSVEDWIQNYTSKLK